MEMCQNWPLFAVFISVYDTLYVKVCNVLICNNICQNYKY